MNSIPDSGASNLVVEVDNGKCQWRESYAPPRGLPDSLRDHWAHDVVASRVEFMPGGVIVRKESACRYLVTIDETASDSIQWVDGVS